MNGSPAKDRQDYRGLSPQRHAGMYTSQVFATMAMADNSVYLYPGRRPYILG